jgi:hypothetical protein
MGWAEGAINWVSRIALGMFLATQLKQNYCVKSKAILTKSTI